MTQVIQPKEFWEAIIARHGRSTVNNFYPPATKGCPFKYPQKVKIKVSETEKKTLIILVPCERCHHCRRMKGQIHLGRIMAEAASHDANLVLTLTLAPAKLPEFKSQLLKAWAKSPKRFKVTPRELRRFIMLHKGLNPYEVSEIPLKAIRSVNHLPERNICKYLKLAHRLLDRDDRFQDLARYDPLDLWSLASVWHWQREAMTDRLRKTHWPNWSPRYEVVYEHGSLGDRPHAHLILFGVPPHEVPHKKTQHENYPHWKWGGVVADNASKKAARYVGGYLHDIEKQNKVIAKARSTELGDAATLKYFQYVQDVEQGVRNRDIRIRNHIDPETGYLEKPYFSIEHSNFPLSRKMRETAIQLGLLPKPDLIDLHFAAEDYLGGDGPEEMVKLEAIRRGRQREIDASYPKKLLFKSASGLDHQL